MDRHVDHDAVGRTASSRTRGGCLTPFKCSLGIGAVLLVAWFVHHFATPPIYDFPVAAPFRGSHWYNPYAERKQHWLRANFHAHARTWKGLTNATHSVEEVWGQYKLRSYDIIGISNYQSIREPFEGEELYVSCYEHGYGLIRQHQTVLGAKSVDWFVFPLSLDVRQKQYVLDRLRKSAPVVIINHPDLDAGYSLDDMTKLTGYTGIEVASKTCRAERYWDAALSAGRVTWGFASDDRHNFGRPTFVPYGWVMIGVGEPSTKTALAALRSGSFYAVWVNNKRLQKTNELRSCTVEAGRLRVTVKEPARVIRFVGQGGKIRHEVRDQASAEYALSAEDTYVRTEVVTRDNILFLNPVLRYEDDPYHTALAQVRPSATLLVRVSAGAVLLSVVVAVWLKLFRPQRRRKQASRVSSGNLQGN